LQNKRGCLKKRDSHQNKTLEAEQILGELEELGCGEPSLDIASDCEEGQNYVSEPIGKSSELKDHNKTEGDEMNYKKDGGDGAKLHTDVNDREGEK
jgi:hypothetical protein